MKKLIAALFRRKPAPINNEVSALKHHIGALEEAIRVLKDINQKDRDRNYKEYRATHLRNNELRDDLIKAAEEIRELRLRMQRFAFLEDHLRLIKDLHLA